MGPLALSILLLISSPLPVDHPCYYEPRSNEDTLDVVLASGWYNCVVEYDKLHVEYSSMVSQKDMWKDMALSQPPPQKELRFSLFGLPEWASITSVVGLVVLGGAIGAAAF